MKTLFILICVITLSGCASKKVKVKNCEPIYTEISGETVSECEEAEDK